MKRILIIAALLAASLITLSSCGEKADPRENKYIGACTRYEMGDYKKALQTFIELGDYKESEEYAERCREMIDAKKAAAQIPGESLEHLEICLLQMNDLTDEQIKFLEDNKADENAEKLTALYYAERTKDFGAIAEIACDICKSDPERADAFGYLWYGYQCKYSESAFGRFGEDISAETETLGFLKTMSALRTHLVGDENALVNACSEENGIGWTLGISDEQWERMGTKPSEKILIFRNREIDIDAMAYLPADKIPLSLEEVKYAVVCEVGYISPFKYTNGEEAKQKYADVYLFSCVDKEKLYTCERVLGGYPPASYTYKIGELSTPTGYGSPCDPEAVADKLKECLERVQ